MRLTNNPPYKGGANNHSQLSRLKGRAMLDGGGVGEVGVGERRGDYNSNQASAASSHDTADFLQDNQDYQWFLDIGYRDGGLQQHPSILSSVTESYCGVGSDGSGYYSVLAANLDANLAEADMESFRTQDIHALLSTLPDMCQLPATCHQHPEMFASVTTSLRDKFAQLDTSADSRNSTTTTTTADSTPSPDTMSICKSELLFSPLKETPLPAAHFSVDSLDDQDLELELEHDIMLTCQANKDNYTIAFEGSVTAYSEDSRTHSQYSEPRGWLCRHHHQLDTSMAHSDSGLTTWSKLQKRSSDHQLRRHPSGNNNHTATTATTTTAMSHSHMLHTRSMPNLHNSHHITTTSSPPFELKKAAHCVKVFDIVHQTNSNSGGYSDMALSVDAAVSNTNTNSSRSHHQHSAGSFSLVRLFMKQKSISAEGMSLAMDQSLEDNSHQRMASSCRATADMFEDSLVEPTNTGQTHNHHHHHHQHQHRQHDLIHEDAEDGGASERSESVEQLSESFCSDKHSPCCHKTIAKFSVNNNNSIEESHRHRQSMSSCHSYGSAGFSNSSTESAECTRIHALKPTVILSKHNAKQFPVHLLNKSMQTSGLVKVVEPSFLAKLRQQGEEQPVYVVYPNYTLPDLDFLKEKQENVAKVILAPQKYSADKEQKHRRPASAMRGRRPFSCNDVEALKKKGFGHVRDWDSLTFLLPVECRQVLADVPEFMEVLKERDEELLKAKEKPLFCVSPPSRVGPRPRPLSCEYNGVGGGIGNGGGGSCHVTTVSSSSSTATQPSSGYRGSSTCLMSDSSPQNSPAPTKDFNPLFVYRYDSVTSSEASSLIQSGRQQQRTTSTITPAPPKRSISLPNGSDQKQLPVDTTLPPRPPLPKGILRKSLLDNCKTRKNIANTKRYSMFDMGGDDKLNEEPAQYYLGRTVSETEDEGVEAGHTTDSSADEWVAELAVRPPTPPLPRTTPSHFQHHNHTHTELDQLDDYLRSSGVSYSDGDETDLLRLRSHVANFLSLKINKDHFDTSLVGKKSVSFAEQINVVHDKQHYCTPPNSPNVSAIMHRHYQGKTLVDMPICEESEQSPEGYSNARLENISLNDKHSSVDLSQKMGLLSAVRQSVEQVIGYFSVASEQAELQMLGDGEQSPACGRLVLSSLCPALYALLSDGLKDTLHTPFGPVPNTVWHLVEAAAQHTPLTQPLHHLVQRINTEHVIQEGLLKFNAFIFGLLNVRSLDAWASYLRTRETVLRKHYHGDSLLLLGHTGSAQVRSLLDSLVATLQPLALLPFHIDLLFETRQLHQSLKRIDAYPQPVSPSHVYSHLSSKQLTLMKMMQSNMSDSDDVSSTATTTQVVRRSTDNSSDVATLPVSDRRQRPRSYVDAAGLKLVDDAAGSLKKRWSDIHIGSKFGQAFERLADDTEEEYTDSLEHQHTHQRRTHNQLKEDTSKSNEEGSSSPAPSLHEDGPESLDSQLSDDKPLNGGKFRRLQMKWEMLSGRDASDSPSPPVAGSPVAHTPNAKSKIPRLVNSPVKSTGSMSVISRQPRPTTTNIAKRTSRVDQLETVPHPRPSSLPYHRPASASTVTKITPPRRAVSSSVTRRPPPKMPKVVRTLSHRLPADNGHLPFNEGEKLRVILEVDAKWLLCCRGDQKGLVPRQAVIAL